MNRLHPERVALFGANGRMGRAMGPAIEACEDLRIVARLGRKTDRQTAVDADVALDFTTADAAAENVEWAIQNRIPIVVGTSGLTADQVDGIRRSLEEYIDPAAVVLVPNFSRAAMLMRQFCRTTAPHFPSVEILDVAHTAKVDAPSGTAVDTAQVIARTLEGTGNATEIVTGGNDLAHNTPAARGSSVNGVPVHSIRMPGMLSQQEVIFSSDEESMTIRFQTLNRAAFAPQVVRALRTAPALRGLHLGLEALYPATEPDHRI